MNFAPPVAGLVVLSALLCAQPPAPLSIRVSEETVPPGGVAQFKVSMTEPKPIVRTGFWSPMDESVFGDLLGIHAAGALSGLARYTGGRLEVSLSSPVAAFTPALDYPVLTFAVRVHDNVPAGTQRSVSLDPDSLLWLNAAGLPYETELKPGALTVGGKMWVSNVLPGGGSLEAGEEVTVTGGGFLPGARVRAEGLRLVAASPTRLTLRAKQPVVLDGEEFRVTNPDREQQEYISYLRGARFSPSIDPQLAGVVPVHGATAATLALTAIPRAAGHLPVLALQNPTASPLTVRVQILSLFGAPLTSGSLTLPPGSSTLRTLVEWTSQAIPASGAAVLVSAPSAFQIAAGSIDDRGGLHAMPAIALRPATY